MNLADSSPKNGETKDCPRGRELVDELKKHNNTYQTYKRIHMAALVMATYQRLRQHVDECADCKEE